MLISAFEIFLRDRTTKSWAAQSFGKLGLDELVVDEALVVNARLCLNLLRVLISVIIFIMRMTRIKRQFIRNELMEFSKATVLENPNEL